MINARRSPTAPASLATGTDWRAPDVLRQLHADFYGKCYLTEAPVAEAGFEVDHRHPRTVGGAPLDWGNLYPAEKGANGRRKKSWPVGGLLQPDGRDDVEGRLEQEIVAEPTDILCLFQAKDPSDVAAVNTAQELYDLHHDDQDADGPNKARDLRRAIQHQLLFVLQKAQVVLDLRHTRAPDDAERRKEEQIFQRLVSRRSPYTMLVRSCVHRKLHDLFD